MFPNRSTIGIRVSVGDAGLVFTTCSKLDRVDATYPIIHLSNRKGNND